MAIENVGVIGLGLMGGGIAKNLLAKGFAVSVYDMAPAAVARLVALGATGADSPAAVGESAQVVISVVPDSPQVQEALLGPRGALRGAKPGTIFVDCSTIDPAASQAIGDQVRAAGCGFVDCGMGGTSTHAEAGTLLFMVGATAEDFALVEPVLRAAAGQIIHCGGPNTGITTKVINNTLAASILSADLEALVLGRKAGVSTEALLAVFRATAANNPALHAQIPNEVLANNYEPGFKAWMMHKDLGLGQNLAARLGVPLFALAPARQLYSAALAKGQGDRAHTIVAQLLEEIVGVKIGEK
ncbi:MAG: NAD(P)-dependent oxidoreductase [Chloroflexota bacterium]